MTTSLTLLPYLDLRKSKCGFECHFSSNEDAKVEDQERDKNRKAHS